MVLVSVRQMAVKRNLKRPSVILPMQSSHLFFKRVYYFVCEPSQLFVGILSFQTGENDLQDYLGVVTSVNLMLDKMTGRSRGFTFVEYTSPAEEQMAVERFPDDGFRGRKITVNMARPREERPPRSDRFREDGERRERFGRGECRERY